MFLLTLLFALSFPSICQTSPGIANLITEPIKYNTFQKVYLKKVNSNSILLFFQNETDDIKYFKRAILIESKEDLSSVLFPAGASYDVVIPQSQKFVALSSKTGEQSFLFSLYDAHENVHAINAKLTGKKPAIVFGYGISFMQNIWNKDNAMKSKREQAIAVLIEANTNIPDEINKLCRLVYLHQVVPPAILVVLGPQVVVLNKDFAQPRFAVYHVMQDIMPVAIQLLLPARA
jgi:hypothetical protein